MVENIGTAQVQEYVAPPHGREVSRQEDQAATVRKEVATPMTVWNRSALPCRAGPVLDEGC